MKKKNPCLQPYFQIRHNISVDRNILLNGDRVIVPETLRKKVLKSLHLHTSHFGLVKMKQTFRNYCWWPKVDVDIENMVKVCYPCSKYAIPPPKVHSEWPEPWSRLLTDFAGPFLGKKWLLMIDAKSKFGDVKDIRNETTATSTIKAIKDTFAKYGYCDVMVSDNGPPFQSHEFKEFKKK